MDSLKDKVVLITGSAGGIGSVTAKLFAQRGTKLVLSDLDQARLDAEVALCKANGAKEVLAIKADMTAMSDLEKLAKTAIERFGKLDVLVNNVGFAKLGQFENITESDYDSIMDVNVKAAFFVTKLLIPELVKTKGTVINLSSAASINPEPRFMAYCVAKAGIDHFTRSLAREYAPKGVRVNAINPGPVRTAFHPDHDALQKIADQQPLCGILEPEMIARWVIWLASAESGPVTGLTILVDGGRTVTRVPAGYGPLK